MAWFYEIRDGADNVVETNGGFATQDAAMQAGWTSRAGSLGFNWQYARQRCRNSVSRSRRHRTVAVKFGGATRS